MPYKYIGRTTDFKGKTLWEIVGNLKNFGIGRIVARSMIERYPEPSYNKIVKVQSLPAPITPSMDDQRKVRVWVEKTFRGKLIPEIMIIELASYKADYKLIPKDEEEAYCNRKVEESELRIFPKTMEFPPLLKELLIREMKAKGEDASDLKLEIVYNKTNYGKYKIAEEGEQPNVQVDAGLGKTKYPCLYEGLDISK